MPYNLQRSGWLGKLCACLLLFSLRVITVHAAAPVVDENHGIAVHAQFTLDPSIIVVSWQVSSQTLSQGANNFAFELYVGGVTQWFGFLYTTDPSDNGAPQAFEIPDPGVFCMRMIATINGTGPILGYGTSGNDPPCAPPPDSDSDGIEDSIDNCPNIANPTQLNSDNDSMGNACDLDDDNDGIPDSYELAHGLDPLNGNDAALDRDTDGLTALQEYRNGTDIDNPDSDGDGYTDGWEVAAGTDPNDPASYPESGFMPWLPLLLD